MKPDLLPFLTDQEILDMTAPLTQKAAIVRWFRREGFVVKIKPNGMPLVARSHFETALSGAQHIAPAQKAEPDVLALLEHLKKGSRKNGQNPEKQRPRTS